MKQGAAMALLEDAVLETAYLKIGIHGLGGAGKTFTAARIALGLSKETGQGAPVAFFDTEDGSDFLIPFFEQHGVRYVRKRSQTYKDLLAYIKLTESAGCSVLIVDSLSLVWDELVNAYLRKKGRERLQRFEYAPINNEWKTFVELYRAAKMHIILCGRTGYDYKDVIGDKGKIESVAYRSKIRAQKETGYEPSICIEMHAVPMSEITGDPQAQGIVNRCVVVKDRTDTMNGAIIDSPTYESFRPLLKAYNIGGKHVSTDTSSSSEELFDGRDDTEDEWRQKKTILLEEIKGAIIAAGFGGQSAEALKVKTELFKRCFNSLSWKKIESMRLDELGAGYRRLEAMLRPAPAPKDDDVILDEPPEDDPAPPHEVGAPHVSNDNNDNNDKNDEAIDASADDYDPAKMVDPEDPTRVYHPDDLFGHGTQYKDTTFADMPTHVLEDLVSPESRGKNQVARSKARAILAYRKKGEERAAIRKASRQASPRTDIEDPDPFESGPVTTPP